MPKLVITLSESDYNLIKCYSYIPNAFLPELEMAILSGEVLPDNAQFNDRPFGQWIDTGTKSEYYAEEYKCSNCGNLNHWGNFCSNCGASMKTSDDSGINAWINEDIDD